MVVPGYTLATMGLKQCVCVCVISHLRHWADGSDHRDSRREGELGRELDTQSLGKTVGGGDGGEQTVRECDVTSNKCDAILPSCEKKIQMTTAAKFKELLYLLFSRFLYKCGSFPRTK